MEEKNVISVRHLIYTLRGENVILDKDIAVLYGVTTGALNQAVKRNPKRFPSDFMFQVTEEEWESLKSQIVIAKTGRGGSRTLPYAFTEHGVLMLASVLKTDIAAQVSINIARTLSEMRRYIATTTSNSAEIAELRAKVELLDNRCEENLRAVNDLSEDIRKEIDDLYLAIGALSIRSQIPEKRNKIGFKRSDENEATK